MNLLFSIIIIVIGTALGYSIYVASIDLISESIGIKAKNIVENVAYNIDMDELQKVTERTLQINIADCPGVKKYCFRILNIYIKYLMK